MTEKILGRQPQLVSGLDGTNKAKEDIIIAQQVAQFKSPPSKIFEGILAPPLAGFLPRP